VTYPAPATIMSGSVLPECSNVFRLYSLRLRFPITRPKARAQAGGRHIGFHARVGTTAAISDCGVAE
jgi:hypothetical protein